MLARFSAHTRPVLSMLVLLCALWMRPADASEIMVSGQASGFALHDAAETLRDFCRTDEQGRLWLEVPGGMRFELITSVDDPAIANPGDGAFHAFDRAEVEAALAAVRFPLSKVRADVFLLPYPRRSGIESAAGRQIILLAPGVRPIAREHQHAEFVHELGHVVQYQMMPDGDLDRWSHYRALRGIDDLARFRTDGAHADRPHEIFAEDFRALFGGALATYSGSIENASIAGPNLIEGLDAFLTGLAQESADLMALTGVPNPTRGAVRFSRPGASDAPLDLFDVQGRHLATVGSRAAGIGTEWPWDGRDAQGAIVPPGPVFARVREPRGASVRVTRLP